MTSKKRKNKTYTPLLKHEWLTNVIHLIREGMIKDVNDYIRYYNGIRLDSTLGYRTSNNYEMSQINVCN